MTPPDDELVQRLAEAHAKIQALMSGQVDAVVDAATQSPRLLAKAQDALLESEERYRRIVETTNEAIWTFDLDLLITFANAPTAALVGWSPEELVGRPLVEVLPEVDRQLRQGIVDDHELEIARRDGDRRWVRLKTSSIRDANLGHVGTLVMMTDCTRARHAAEALRLSEQQYRQIVEETSDGISKLDSAGRIVFANRRFAAMLGYQPAELLGRHAADLIAPSARRQTLELLSQRNDHTPSLDSTFLHRDGTEVAVNLTANIVRDEDGRDIGDMAVVRDVTERKKLQSQLMVSDRMASIGTLAAGVAHEINNPLAAVIANLEYMSTSLTTEAADPAWLRSELREPLADAREAAQQVRSIVRDLKVFSRSEAEEPRAAVDVHAVIESSLRMAWNEIRHRARLLKRFAPLPLVAANEARLGQVFLNLIVNAAQAIPEGRAEHNEIWVITRREGERVVVEVRDTGPGIPPEIVGRVFDAFFTTKIGVGTGLGLAICHRIITDLGGELTVTSEVGVGTTFRVSLPVAQVVELEPPTTAPLPAPAGRRGRVLIVDDEERLGRTIQRILAKDHDVTVTTGARDALAQLAASEPFDVILCDLMMPEMTGMDLHRELSRIAPEQADRMIFVTGGAFTADARQFLTQTPREHLEKPFSTTNLRAIVQRYVR